MSENAYTQEAVVVEHMSDWDYLQLPYEEDAPSGPPPLILEVSNEGRDRRWEEVELPFKLTREECRTRRVVGASDQRGTLVQVRVPRDVQ